jgi:hypothetical protein
MSLHKWIDINAWNEFTRAMLDKLEVAREKGKSGWHDPRITTERELAQMMIAHLRKDNENNFVDIANFCMFLHQRGVSPSVIVQELEHADQMRVGAFSKRIRELEDVLDRAVFPCFVCTEQGAEGNCHEAENLRIDDDGNMVCQVCWDEWSVDEGETRSWDDLRPLRTWG